MMDTLQILATFCIGLAIILFLMRKPKKWVIAALAPAVIIQGVRDVIRGDMIALAITSLGILLICIYFIRPESKAEKI